MKSVTVLPGDIIPAPNDGQPDMLRPSILGWLYNHDWTLPQALLEIIARLRAALNDSYSRNRELEAEINRLNAENHVLRDENQKLHEQANLDSQTSGIPSGKDWKNKGACGDADETAGSNEDQDSRKDGRESPISVSGYLNSNGGEKKRQGGQKNHPPAFMFIGGAQDGEPVQHYPDKCKNCPHFNKCIEEGQFRLAGTGHEYDVEINLVHTEQQVYEAPKCPQDGGVKRDAPPEGGVGPRHYGMGIHILVLVWHHLFHGSYVRIAQAAKEMLGLSLSAGTAIAIVRRASAKILGSGLVDAIRFYILLFESVAGVDETSALTGSINAWVHTVATAGATLLSPHWKRGFDGTVYAGIVQFFTKTLISDCWAAYFNENFKFKHAICDAHILRELVAAAYFRGQRWAIDMFDLLLEVFTAKKDAVARGEKSLSQVYINDIRDRFRKIVADGYAENPGVTKGKTFALLERLSKLEDAALEFAVDFNVDFSNNASEISLRNLKVALQVIGQFKTMKGLVDYCIIQSFMDTCRKQGRNPFDMMKVLLSGGDIIKAVFGAEKAALIKTMIRLADAFAIGDTDEIDAIKTQLGPLLTDELIEAASYGRFRPFDGPPPEDKKDASKAPPKDKMKAARQKLLPNNFPNSEAAQSDVSIRAGPNCA